MLLALTSRIHTLQLQRIDKNPGVLILKQGQASVSYNKWTIIKVLGLSSIHEDLEFNIKRYANFNEYIQKHLGNETSNYQLFDIKLQTDYIMNSSIEKFKQLAPSMRIKRGILNPLGSIIKIITGNLDNDDASRYDNMISDIKTRQDALANKVTLITEISKTLVKITNSTKNNFIQIEEEIWEMTKLINQTSINIAIHNFVNIYNLFLHNFQLLYSRLNDIEISVTFSKLKILHQSLIKSDELFKSLKIIEKSNKLMYEVSYDNLVKLEQCIEIKAYSKGSQITFILEIPIIKDEIYTYYRAIPIPVTNHFNQTTIIIPKYPYLLVKGSEIVSLSQPCNELYGAKFLCYEDESQLPMEDTCITALMRFSHNTSSCYPVPVEIHTLKIQPVGKRRWIIYSRGESILSEICNNEITKEEIIGTYSLTLEGHCDVKIGRVTLKSNHTTTSNIDSSKLPIVNLPDVTPIEPHLQRKPINLETSDLTNLQHLNNLLEVSKSEVKIDSEKSINVKSISVGTLVLYIIIVLSISVFIARKYEKTIKKCLCRNDRSENNHPNDNHPSDNFELMGGGVMHAVSAPNIITSC